MVDRTDVEAYLDVERYGVGFPFGSLSVALGLFVFAFPGLSRYHALTVYGKIGVAFLVTIIVSLLVVSGYTFRMVDIDQFVRRKTDIREEHESEQSESDEEEP